MINWITYFLLFATSVSFAQLDPVVYETEWFLRNFREDFTRPIPLDAEVYPITLDINETSPIFSTTVCATLSMDIGFENADFFNIVSPITVTDETCEVDANQVFQDAYFNFFTSSPDENFIFTVTTLPDNPDELFLFIVRPDGAELLYSDVPLLDVPSTQLQEIFLSPNPAEEVVYLTNVNAQSLTYTLYNTLGKIVQPLRPLQEATFNVGHLQSGMYFVQLEDSFGNVSLKKLIVK